ncbi:hypothetical protein A3C32_04330 [Candidatus Daviesbacteria bacterium RIFCSPHIGHO2_02_FULL_41_14]|nr:MAG: hypothetical protein A3C32_04330 [Candidatus Daviesbacteria bacterium RIFCSPHIGHO2_02_FULL_41_14]
MKKIIILGAGGNSRDIVDMIADINELRETYQLIGILDDDRKLKGSKIMDVKVLGTIKDAYRYTDCYFVNGVYSVINFFTNEDILKRSGISLRKFVTIIHPTASISRTVKLGKGVVVLPGVVLRTNVHIGNHVTLHPGVVVGHDTKIGDFTFLASKVAVGGYVRISKSCFIGSNSTLRERIKLGRYSIVGMGSVVLKDVPDESVFVGNPAKFLKKSRQ